MRSLLRLHAVFADCDPIPPVLSGVTALLLAVLAGLGRLTPALYPDTAGYLELGSYPDNLGGLRHPLYGWLVAALSPIPGDYAAIPLIQVMLYASAVLVLARALRILGLGWRARLAACLPLLLANPLLLYGNGVHPELPAIACALAAIAAVAAAAVSPHWIKAAAGAGMAAGAAYFLRPSFLPLIGVLPLLLAVWSRLYTGRVRKKSVAVCLVAVLVPFLGFSALRQHAVGDFNVVSFGGFQMAGMAAFLLTPDVAERLPADVAPTARRLVADYRDAVTEGRVAPLPLNSSGERSYASAALGYFDVIARTHDTVLYGVVDRLREPGESWVAFNARMQRLAIATVRAAPGHYTEWVIGATTRFVGHALVDNLAFGLAMIGLAAAYVRHLLRPSKTRGEGTETRDTDALIALTAAYTLAAGVLSVLTTFPAQRYIDTAGIFLAALPLYGLLCLTRPGGR